MHSTLSMYMYRYLRIEYDCIPAKCTAPAPVRDADGKYCVSACVAGAYGTTNGCVNCSAGTYQVSSRLVSRARHVADAGILGACVFYPPTTRKAAREFRYSLCSYLTFDVLSLTHCTTTVTLTLTKYLLQSGLSLISGSLRL